MVRTHTLQGTFGVDPSTLETEFDAGTIEFDSIMLTQPRKLWRGY